MTDSGREKCHNKVVKCSEDKDELGDDVDGGTNYWLKDVYNP